MPYNPGGFSQSVTLPSDGSYLLTYLALGQFDPVTVTTSIGGVQETFTPPPTVASVSVTPWLLTGADWSRRSLTFAGSKDQVVTLTVSASNASSGINGTIAVFDNFVLKKQ